MSWRQVKLGELLDNFSVRAKDVGGADGLYFFGVSNEEGIIKTKYAAEDKAEDYKIIEKGCFAYNPYRVNVGSIGLVSDETRGLISPAYVVFKPKPKSIIPELLFKFLKSDEGLRQIIFYARGTVRQALRFEDLCNIEISIPDYSEQISLYNKLINSQKSSNVLAAELKNQQELLKKLRQQLLQDAVQGKLVEQNKQDEPAIELLTKIKAEKEKLNSGKKVKKEKELTPIKIEEMPFEIPEKWEWCRLGDLIISMTNGIYKEEKYYNDDGIGCFRMYNIKDGILNFDKLKKMILTDSELKTYGLESNDLLLNRVNSVELLGKAALVKNITENYVFESKNIRVRFFKKEVIAPFINYLFLTNVTKDQILKAFTKVTGQASISQEKLYPLFIPLPPLAEQIRIVEKVNELMQYCNELEASIRKSETQNVKLLQQVLREALRK